MAWDGQGGRNFSGPLQKNAGPRGMSALDVVIQGGFLPLSAGPLEFGDWLLGPSLTIAADLNATVTAAIAAQSGPILDAAQSYMTGAGTFASLASGFSSDAAGSAGSATASATAAAVSAAAAAAAVVANKATVAEIQAQTNDVHYPTSKGLSDALAWVPAAGGEITTPAGVRTVAFNLFTGFNKSDTLTAATTYAPPTNMVDGQVYQFLLIQNGTGGWAITMNAMFVFGSVAASFVTTANAYNIVTGTYHAGLNKLIGCTVWKSA